MSRASATVIVSELLVWFAAAIMALSWLAGVVLATPIMGKVFAVICPPYAWYLVMEKAMMLTQIKP